MAPRHPRDPLQGVDQLVIDGDNVIHSAELWGAGPADPQARRRFLVGQLRGAIPARVQIDLVFDGPPEPGMGSARISHGLTVHYAAPRPADLRIVELASLHARSSPRTVLLAVTEDRELAARLRDHGARVVDPTWLLQRIFARSPSAPVAGRPRPPADQREAPEEDEDRPWRPGRRATVKKGNPHRHRR
jgi:predicted RNA-binding protein with PIN domain